METKKLCSKNNNFSFTFRTTFLEQSKDKRVKERVLFTRYLFLRDKSISKNIGKFIFLRLYYRQNGEDVN